MYELLYYLQSMNTTCLVAPFHDGHNLFVCLFDTFLVNKAVLFPQQNLFESETSSAICKNTKCIVFDSD